jgi:hypothetical protein
MWKAVANKRFRATISCRHLPEVLQLAGSHPAMDLGGLAAARGPDGLRLRPLSAMGGAVRLHAAGVDRGRQRENALGHEGVKDAAPELPAGPAVVDRRRRSVFGRAVLPAAACLQYVKDAADDAAIVDPARAGRVLRKVWLDRRPRPSFTQKSCSSPPLQNDGRESDLLDSFNSLIGFRPLAAQG